MILLKIIIYFFLFVFSFKVYSISLTKQLSIFFKKEYLLKKDDVNVIVHPSSNNKKMFCKKPIFSLISNFHYSDLLNVLLTCEKKHQYLTVEIRAKGEYVTANRKIPRGTKIQESDLKILTGQLDLLPNNTYRQKKEVINRVNLRDIFELQPITSFITRPFWLVKVNQQVTVIINEKNFTIFSKAQSLSNGAQNEYIRVKTNAGKIVTGMVNKNGEVIVFL